MKKSTKLLALFLAVVMLSSSICFGANAVLIGGETPYVPVDDDVLPTIIVPGLFQSETKYYDENGDVALDANGEEYKMPFFMDTTMEIAGAALQDALMPILSMIGNQEDKEQKAAHAVADILSETLMGKQKLDETGHFINDIRATEYNDCYGDLSKHDKETIFEHFPLEYYTKHAGEDKLYVFSYASLDNMMDIAYRLYDYIQFVKEDSGYDKVNIVPISQGGSVFVALMQIYEEKGRSMADDFVKIVFAVPALNGSTLVGEILEKGLMDDDKELYKEMLPALLGEDDYLGYLINIVLRFLPNADVNNILDIVFDTFIREYAGYSTALWGLCPVENYPGAREIYLTDDCMAQIAEQTDWYYNAQLNYKDYLLKAADEGVQIFDIVDYNVPLLRIVDSWDIPSDGIIQIESTSMGAYGIANNVKLPADYVPTHSNCTDPENHDHSDPHGFIDPCTALFPETTFYFFEQSHESSASNDVFMKLACSIMMDSNFTSVHSYPDVFPQFNGARKTKNLMKDIAEMQEYDTSKLSSEDRIELEESIMQATEMLDNTIIDTDEEAAAKTRFYAIRDKIVDAENGVTEPENPTGEKENTAYLDFSYALKDLIYILSELFYILFGGNGFSDL